MSAALQESLLDVIDDVAVLPLDGAVRRTELSRGAWIDIRRGWVSGSGPLFERLESEVPWYAEKRAMWDKILDVPRLLAFYGEQAPLPDPALDEAKRLLDDYYGAGLRESFATAGLCLYRDGRDSVAWHGDTLGRGKTEDTMVAILSLGAPRTLMLRPRGGGTALKHSLGHGDLIVMGGSCQRTWEHAVPKTSRPVGPRISVQFRPRGVR